MKLNDTRKSYFSLKTWNYKQYEYGERNVAV